MATKVSTSGGVTRATVNRSPTPAPAARPTPARTASARRAPAPAVTPEALHALARQHAEKAAAMLHAASYTKGRALGHEAIQAAAALGWGKPLSATQSNTASGLPLTFNFKNGKLLEAPGTRAGGLHELIGMPRTVGEPRPVGWRNLLRDQRNCRGNCPPRTEAAELRRGELLGLAGYLA
jgi:hypothetical protein